MTSASLHRRLGFGLAAAIFATVAATPAFALTKVKYGLNWVPEGEHCGFFQAKGKGYYEAAGLDVTLVPGNPNVNLPLLVASGEIDLGMGSSFTTLNLVNRGVKARTVAAFFQKDPQTLVAHPDQGIATLDDMKGKPIMVGQFSRSEYWQFLKASKGFDDSQLRPFSYTAGPFLADKKAIQQGYITEDAMMLGKELPKPPVSILLADYGYDNYATTVFATEKYIAANKATVQAFVDASKKGWADCMSGDFGPAMKGVLEIVPTGGEELFKFKIDQMKSRGLVDGGDAAKLGLGAMTDVRWKAFFDVMTKAGVYPASLDYKQAYTLDFLGAK
ncbi:ABC transporter substrate-binding protein [Chelatococcus sambhunathii]|uniref:ABC transporter substrate-binding protein n=1 Tax=Chelatococcus sambhunathii TaxID=363953 RepID=A0ABU1DD08_9HYPH|nr:ABC transporter substrate-binding protein [Chelatococcus sambhunathii]MDR4306000.1 ABC transporter substrate-binding protein [Chelatococcus sambhunathii]